MRTGVEEAAGLGAPGRRRPSGKTAVPQAPVAEGGAEAPPMIDGRYLIESEIGHGGMGVVYRARDVWLDRAVALKVMDGTRVDDAPTRRQFVAEARALARICNSHVVRVHAFGEHGTSLFFAMELVEGRTLSTMLTTQRSRGEPLRIAEALTLLDGVADGLDAVHRAGLLHRDVKPANVVVEAGTERTVLVDLGLTLDLRCLLPDAPWGGTPDYMAPELCRGERGSSASDVYAFGCIAFEVLTGELPFAASSPRDLREMHARAPRPRASWVRPGLAPADVALRRGLARDPRDRPGSAAALMQEVRLALAPATVAQTPRPAPGVRAGQALILILEADADQSRVCARAAAIAFHGSHRLVVARTAKSAIDLLDGQTPRIVLVDLEDRKNLDAVQTIRDMPGGTHACVIGLHLSSSPNDDVRLLDLEVLDLLPLPLDYDDILSGLQIIARRRGLSPATGEDRTRPISER